jgi:hypothetical protein
MNQSPENQGEENQGPESQAPLNDALLESLLQIAYKGDCNEEQRVGRVLSVINSELSVEKPITDTMARPWRNRWVAFALAASVLVVLGLSIHYFPTNNAAYAAVIRSMGATPKTRTYRIHMVHQRPIWGNREVVADLYLNDHDQFVVRHPGWSRFGELWIGGDSTSRWIAPRIGPAFVGGEEVVGGWLAKKDIPSPYLHVTTILKRMSRAYRLTLNENQVFPGIEWALESTVCQHIVGELEQSNNMLPTKIELWAKHDSGIAQRLDLTWSRAASDRGPIRWTIDLVNTDELPNSWFSLEGHITTNRRIVTIQSLSELDAVEVEPQ